jgi:DNA-binding Lrp family transcriptional regulator
MGVKNAPEEVRQAFEQLKVATGKRLSLHAISGQHYVYEYSSSTDSRTGKTVVRTYYIGHITKDGKFIAKGERKLAMLEVKDREGSTKIDDQYDEREAIALRNLSMNGRMSMAKLARRIGMSVTGTRHFVRRLEKKYNIRYFAEVNTLKLGYLRYIALVKFEDKIPTVKEVKEAFEDDPHVALVAMTKGIYDMVVIFYLESSTSVVSPFIYEWRKSKALPDYSARWYITPLDMASGMALPLRKQVAEWIKEEAAKKEKFGRKLTNIEGIVLKELINNGSQEFNDIDKRYGFGNGRSNYAFYQLKQNEIVERVTITVNPPNLRYNVIFITETNNYKKFVENQDRYRLDAINQDRTILNKNAYRGDMGAPDSIFHIRPIFEESEFQKARNLLDSISGTRTESLIVTDIVTGSLCYRNFDPTYTKVYNSLVKNGKIHAVSRLDY